PREGPAGAVADVAAEAAGGALAVRRDAELVVRAAAAGLGVDRQLRRRRNGDVDAAAAGLDAVLAAERALDAHRAAAGLDVDGAADVAHLDAAAARAQRHRARRAVDFDAAAAGVDLDAAAEAARADAAAAGPDLQL